MPVEWTHEQRTNLIPTFARTGVEIRPVTILMGYRYKYRVLEDDQRTTTGYPATFPQQSKMVGVSNQQVAFIVVNATWEFASSWMSCSAWRADVALAQGLCLWEASVSGWATSLEHDSQCVWTEGEVASECSCREGAILRLREPIRELIDHVGGRTQGSIRYHRQANTASLAMQCPLMQQCRYGNWQKRDLA